MLAKRAGHKLAVGSACADGVARVVGGKGTAEAVGYAAVTSTPVGKVFKRTGLTRRGSNAAEVSLTCSIRAQRVAE